MERQYCCSDDESVIEKGVQNVKHIFADNFQAMSQILYGPAVVFMKKIIYNVRVPHR